MNEINEEPASAVNGGMAGRDFRADGGASERSAAESEPVEEKRGGAQPSAEKPAGAEKKPAGAKAHKSAERESVVETIKTIAYALLIALFIRTFLFQPFNIPSASMEATLLIGDYLFVEKYAYGYSRYSFPWGLGPFSGRIWAGSGPKRGDVVVFKLPSDNSTDYIKRVIGLPGDRIQLINGQIYLNNKPVPRVRVADYVETDSLGNPHHVTRYRETLPGGKSYDVLARNPSWFANNTDVYVVPPGHYFMMGDNRDNSSDSRFSPDGIGSYQSSEGVSYVPAENLVGKAEFIFFSNDGPLWMFWRLPRSIRYSRMFTAID